MKILNLWMLTVLLFLLFPPDATAGTFSLPSAPFKAYGLTSQVKYQLPANLRQLNTSLEQLKLGAGLRFEVKQGTTVGFSYSSLYPLTDQGVIQLSVKHRF